MNSNVIKILESLAQISDIRGDKYREHAYRGAIVSIRNLGWELDDIIRLENEKIPNVGKSIKKKIIEYVRTGSVKELVQLQNSNEVKAYLEFSKIAGVGPKLIAQWIRSGILGIPALRKQLASGKVVFNKVQMYGLMYYIDLNTPIPRDEVRIVGSKIIALVKNYVGTTKTLHAEIVGSYRREAAASGDIDIITSGAYSLRDLENELKHDPMYVDTFSIGSERFTFIYRSNNIVRQVDILNLPVEQYWSGILYFTGGWEFNTAMRSAAKSRGYLLNQRGLFRIRGTKQCVVRTQSEKDIFDTIGLVYVEPKDRTGADKISFQ